MMCPCKDCEDREIGCHSKCEKYKKFRDDVDASNEARRKETFAESYRIKSCISMKKKRRRK